MQFPCTPILRLSHRSWSVRSRTVGTAGHVETHCVLWQAGHLFPLSHVTVEEPGGRTFGTGSWGAFEVCPFGLTCRTCHETIYRRPDGDWDLLYQSKDRSWLCLGLDDEGPHIPMLPAAVAA